MGPGHYERFMWKKSVQKVEEMGYFPRNSHQTSSSRVKISLSFPVNLRMV